MRGASCRSEATDSLFTPPLTSHKKRPRCISTPAALSRAGNRPAHARHAARKMPQPYEFDLLHADGIRHADLDAGVRLLNELIFECQRSLEDIEHARLDLEA